MGRTRWSVHKVAGEWVAEAPTHHDQWHTGDDALVREYKRSNFTEAFRVAGMLAASDARY
jgi:pterin-4a-carbinolamine dehydratase